MNATDQKSVGFNQRVRMEKRQQPRMNTNGRGCVLVPESDTPELSVLIRVHPWFYVFAWAATAGRANKTAPLLLKEGWPQAGVVFEGLPMSDEPIIGAPS
jgi:hypothetical protein